MVSSGKTSRTGKHGSCMSLYHAVFCSRGSWFLVQKKTKKHGRDEIVCLNRIGDRIILSQNVDGRQLK